MKPQDYQYFQSLFNRELSLASQEGLCALMKQSLAACHERPVAQTAYVLATAYWESGLQFLPVREGLKDTDEAAREYVQSLFDEGKIRQNYASPAQNGQSFYGRGLVQITWENNYRKMGEALIGDEDFLYEAPDRALEPKLARIIILRGMIDGLFTDYKLLDFINGNQCDYLHARQIVNAMDRAERLADWAQKMQALVEFMIK